MSRRIVLVGLVVLTLATSGCRGQAQPEPGPVSSPTVAPVAGPVAFHVQLGAGQTMTIRSPKPGGCPGFDAMINLGSDRNVELMAFGTSCVAAAGDNAQPGNGRHGVYRTTMDIPADRLSAAVAVHTVLGEATVFNQPYYECTNSCKNYTEPVAIVMLAHPSDPEYQTLMAVAVKGSIGLDQLSAFLRDQVLA